MRRFLIWDFDSTLKEPIDSGKFISFHYSKERHKNGKIVVEAKRSASLENGLINLYEQWNKSPLSSGK